MSTVVIVAVLVGLVGFVLGARSADFRLSVTPQNAQLAADLDYSGVEKAYDELRDKFDGKLDTTKLLEGAKKGLVEAAGDPYTVYFTPDEAKQFLNDLEGKFSGIGAELDRRDDKLIIVTTIDDSPARKAQLQPNDQIIKVNDEDAAEWSIDKAVSTIRGEKGTTVKLTIVRNNEVKEFSIVRAEIVNPSARYEITADNIGVLRLSRFAESETFAIAQKAAQEFKAKNVKGVVVDVRGNGGGYLNAAQDIAGIWLNNKVVVEEKQGDKVIDTLRTGNNAILAGVPTIVLMDGGSASASEILAGALRDNKAATLVGTKSFGKGSVQQIEELPGGGQLKVTVAKWYTPNGKNISKEGIEPDVKVEATAAEIAAGADSQQAKAVELLKAGQ